MDTELDAMLTETEDMAEVEVPQDDVIDAEDIDDVESAGRQPDTAQDTPDADGDAQGDKPKDSVPLRTHIDMRRTLRQQARMQRAEYLEEVRELRAQVEEIRGRTSKETDHSTSETTDEADDYAPLTRADLRRIETEKSQEAAERVRKDQLARVQQSLQTADQTQQRLLQMAEPYLTKADRKAIVESDDILSTVVDVAKARIEMFGEDADVDWLDANLPSSTKQKQSASQTNTTTKDRPRRARAVETSPEQTEDLETSSNVRGVLDHMFG